MADPNQNGTAPDTLPADFFQKQAAPQAQTAPDTLPADFNFSQGKAPERSTFDKVKDAVIGPTTALGSVGDEFDSLKDALHSHFGETAKRALDNETTTVHVIQGSPIEKAIQIIDPSFKGALTPQQVEEQQAGQAINKPFIDAGRTIDKGKHPMLKAIAETASSLTTPGNIAVLAGTGGLGLIESPAKLAISSKLLSAGFTAQAIGSLYKNSKAFVKAYEDGDANEALYQLTHAITSGAMAVMAGTHAAGGKLPLAGDTDLRVVKSVAGALDRTGTAIQNSPLGRLADEKFGPKPKTVGPAPEKVQQANEDFQKSIPSGPGKAAYEQEDIDRVRPYLDRYHTTVSDIKNPEHVYDALEHQRQGIENEIKPWTQGKYANEPLKIEDAAGTPVSLKQKLVEALKDDEDQRPGFTEKALKTLDDYNTTDLSMSEGDKLRKTLNDDNRAVLQKDRMDINTARATNPDFAARYELNNILRDGIYDRLEDKGVLNAREMRQDEASIIKVRNAADRMIPRGESTVKGTSEVGPIRQGAAWLAKKAGIAGGAAVGAATEIPGGAELGAVGGGMLGEKVASLLSPEDLTRNELLQRSMDVRATQGAPRQLDVANAQPSNPPAEAIPPAPSPRESSQLHADLATHYSEQMGETPYKDLEQRFLDDVKLKRQYKVPLDPAEKRLLSSVNNAQYQEKVKANEDALKQKEATETAEKEAADQKLEEQSSGILRHAPFEAGEHLPLPDRATAKGITPQGIMTHEASHLAAAALAGRRVIDIVSHNHDQISQGALGEARWDKSDFMNDDGEWDMGKIKQHLPEVLTTMFAGPVGEELVHGTELEKNPAARGDLKRARGLAKLAGFSDVETGMMLKTAEMAARKMLNKPGVMDVIKRYTEHREAGLDDDTLMSGETAGKMVAEINNLGGGDGEGNESRPNAERNGKDVKERKPGGKGATESGAKKEVRDAGKTGASAGSGEGREEKPEVKTEANDFEPSKTPPERSTGDEAADKAIREGGAIPGGRLGDLEDPNHVKMFHEPQSGSTLGIKGTEPVTAEAVRKQVAEKQAQYAAVPQVEAHRANGGSTFSADGKNLAGKDLYSVGSYPERTQHVDTLSSEALAKFKTDNADLLADGKHAVGTWQDPATGKTDLDITKLHENREQAIAEGKAKNQKAIYHLGSGETIDTGGTGQGPGDLMKNNADPDDVLDNIKRAYGVHNDAKMEGSASFITPDAKHIDLPSGVDHTDAIEQHGGDKTSGTHDNRSTFINNTGAIRVHKARERAGNVLAFSLPRDGVTPAQIAEMEKSVAANGDPNGLLRIERADINHLNFQDAHAEKEFGKASDVKEMVDRIYGKKAAPVGAGARAALDQQIAAAESGAKQAEPADKYYTPGGRLKIDDLMRNNVQPDKKRYVYHSTAANNLPSIAEQGLNPSNDPQWGGDLGRASAGKVFFAHSPEDAHYYGEINFREKLSNDGFAHAPITIRTKTPEGAESKGSGSNQESWVKKGIPPKNLEAYWGGKWRSIKDAADLASEHSYVQDSNGTYSGENFSGDTLGDVLRDAKETSVPNTLKSEESNAEGDRISTRVPEGKDATEDPLGQPLHIDREALSRAPEKLKDKFAQKAREVAGVKIPKNITDNEKIYDRFQRHVADNLKYVYNKATPEEKVANAKWYESANKLTKDLADKQGVTHQQAAGVTAAMSPQMDWDANVSLAKRIVDIYKNKMDQTVTPEMIQKGKDIIAGSRKGKDKAANSNMEQILPQIAGKKIGDLDGFDRAAAVRLYDEVNGSKDFPRIDPATGNEMEARTNDDGSKQVLSWGSLANVSKALSILDNDSRENISNQVGKSHKVRNFYNNIIDPTDPNSVTIDTHAVGAATLQPLGGNAPEVLDNFGRAGKNKGTGVSGNYALTADAYRQAAKELGILPRELQSVTWEKIRSLFPAEWKTKANLAAVKAEWKKYTDGDQTANESRDNIVKMAAEAGAVKAAKVEALNAKAQNAPVTGRINVFDFLKALRDNKEGGPAGLTGSAQ